jgi:hypothetical protein
MAGPFCFMQGRPKEYSVSSIAGDPARLMRAIVEAARSRGAADVTCAMRGPHEIVVSFAPPMEPVIVSALRSLGGR